MKLSPENARDAARVRLNTALPYHFPSAWIRDDGRAWAGGDGRHVPLEDIHNSNRRVVGPMVTKKMGELARGKISMAVLEPGPRTEELRAIRASLTSLTLGLHLPITKRQREIVATQAEREIIDPSGQKAIFSANFLERPHFAERLEDRFPELRKRMRADVDTALDADDSNSERVMRLMDDLWEGQGNDLYFILPPHLDIDRDTPGFTSSEFHQIVSTSITGID